MSLGRVRVIIHVSFLVLNERMTLFHVSIFRDLNREIPIMSNIFPVNRSLATTTQTPMPKNPSTFTSRSCSSSPLTVRYTMSDESKPEETPAAAPEETKAEEEPKAEEEAAPADDEDKVKEEESTATFEPVVSSCCR